MAHSWCEFEQGDEEEMGDAGVPDDDWLMIADEELTLKRCNNKTHIVDRMDPVHDTCTHNDAQLTQTIIDVENNVYVILQCL